jgi:hypothetical protein
MALGNCDVSPYSAEPLYSDQTRIRLHFAVTSLLKRYLRACTIIEVFQLLGYLSHLQRLVNVIPTTASLSATQLIYAHTLFTLAAPSMPTTRRRKIEALMLSDNDNSSHVMFAYAADKLPTKNLRSVFVVVYFF